MADPEKTGVICPRCHRVRGVVTSEPGAICQTFECRECGHKWWALAPDPPPPPPKDC